MTNLETDRKLKGHKMSLLKEINKAKNNGGRLGGWSHFDTWNLTKTEFETREEAESAYETTRPIYDDIAENQTWEGLQSQGKSPVATEVSFRHHIWIDEHDNGFSLCVSFDNGKQARDFKNRAQETLEGKTFSFSPFQILQGQSDTINRYMTATHSVEIDILDASVKDLAKKNFEISAKSTALYTDVISKPNGVDRVKAYFDNGPAASAFAKSVSTSQPVVREFPAAKPLQPTKMQVA